MAKLRPGVEVVVAGRAVGAERELHAQRVELRHARDARAELQVRAGAVDDARALGRHGRAPRRRRAARRARGPRAARRRPSAAGRRRRRPPARARTASRSLGCSAACVCTSSPRSRRALDGAAHELLAARQDEPRRPRVPDAPAARTAPVARQPLALVEARARRLAQPRGHAVALVHHRLARQGPDARAHARVHHGVVAVHRPHVEDRRRPPEHRLGQPELGARAERRLVVRRLERPDALPQPLEQRQVVRHPAEEHLAQVHVRLHEARDDGAAARVDDARQALGGSHARRPPRWRRPGRARRPGRPGPRRRT